MSPLTTQVTASLEEQNFTELWGKRAKELYGDKWNNFSDPQLRKIIGSIQTLGPSNLPLELREKVGKVAVEPWARLGCCEMPWRDFPQASRVRCWPVAFWRVSLASTQRLRRRWGAIFRG